MGKVKNPTNLQIAKELCKQNPNSRYAGVLGYDKDTGEIAVKDLSIFTSTPDIANEFLSDMANKIIVQRTYDLFRDYKMPFSSFMREMSKLGDAEELLTAELASPGNWSDNTASNDPFDADKPSIKLAWVKTEDKKVVGVRLNYEVWAGAFTSEMGLSNIAGIILKNLRDSIEEYLRNAIKADLANALIVSKTQVVTAISGAGDTANAQKAYEEIIELATKMTIPSDDYNTAEVDTFTPKGRFVLVLNPRYFASFKVNVFASLFNSNVIGEDKFFKEVIVTDYAGSNDEIGVLLDDEAYLFGNRIDLAQSILNPKTMEINTYYHRWIKRAGVPFRQAVRLLGTGAGE